MPIYEYQCEACHAATEVMQKSSDPAPDKCGSCGKGPMVKQLSLSAFSLKGTGWYVTDFKGGASQKAPDSTTKSETTPKSTQDSQAPKK